MNILPVNHDQACLVGRVWNADVGGPSIVKIVGEDAVDITSRSVPTMRDLLEMDDPAAFVRAQSGPVLGSVHDIAVSSDGRADHLLPLHFLAPCDLQAVKACGVTFARSMIERVIEEKAKGDAAKAEVIRQQCQDILGANLGDVRAGSTQAEEVKAALVAAGMWSQYLEVGIGPDAEIFTKAQPMASVGWGDHVGLHPGSIWNNPEPEIVLAVNSRGAIKGASLGNDVNLRDVEGRSALLLGKAKDNNASSAIGPFVRLFDDHYSIDEVRNADLSLTVSGADGFELHGQSSMTMISRDPVDLVTQTIGAHHQYPDGFFLYLGTMFAPTQDRGAAGSGFTHKIDDVVVISEPRLGALQNRVALSPDCPPWTFGTADLMRNLASRGLI